MSIDKASETTYAKNGFNRQVVSNQIILEQRVKAIHQDRIKVLQKEMVEISLQNGHWSKIVPILEEIKKVRALLSFSDRRTQSC